MKTEILQELVKKIFRDEKTKSEFEKDPESVLARFDLTETEKRAVLHTQTRLGFVTSDSQQLEAAIKPTEGWYTPAP